MVAELETLGGALEDVRAFCAVMELGSISAAARRQGETKGAVSRRLSRLEGRLGTRLLTRTPRAVSATEEGLAFHAKARDALDLLDDAAEGARQSRAVPRGHLRITAPHDLGLDVLPDLIARFRDRHAHITVELLLTDAALDLAANRIDLALRATSGSLPDMGYRATPLMDFHIRLYASPDYVSRHGQPETPAELAGHDLVVNRERARGVEPLSLTNRRGRHARVQARPVIHTSDYAGVHRLVVAGCGIGGMADIAATPAVETGYLVPVLPDWTLAPARLHGITVAGREAPARVRVFLDFMREQMTRLPG